MKKFYQAGLGALIMGAVALQPKISIGQELPKTYTEMYKPGYADTDKNGIDDRIDQAMKEGSWYCYRTAPGFIDENNNGRDDRDEQGIVKPRGPMYPGCPGAGYNRGWHRGPWW
jgi:hypothetical protein